MNALFSRFFATAAVAAAAFVAPAAHAQSGEGYITITPQPSDAPDKIEVLEFFAYTCPHCAAMEPMVREWEKKAPQDVMVKGVPIAFNQSMKPLQHLYYTLMALEREDLHPKVFAAIHTEKQRLFTKPAMIDLAVKQGIDRAKFESTFDSFSVNAQVQRADQLADAYKIEGTPSLAVGGMYITSPVMAGNSYVGAIQQLDKLVPMARQKPKKN